MSGSSSLSYLLYGIFVAVITVYPFLVYNKFVSLSNRADKAFANIDVWLRQRSDELPNLCAIVAAHSSHEKDVLRALTELRAQHLAAHDIDSKVSTNNTLTNLLLGLLLRLESSPKLTTESVYKKIAKRIERLHDQIADQQTLYNDSVTIFNDELQRIPQCWVAKLLRIRPHLLLSELSIKNQTTTDNT